MERVWSYHYFPSLNYFRYLFMSCLQNEALLETIYDECWEEYRLKNNLTSDQLDALDQDSELGYLPEIANKAQQRFEELCQ